MKNSLFLFVVLLIAPFCKADQLAWITEEQALEATKYIRGQSTIILWCGCCPGNNPKRIISVTNVYYESTGTDDYYHVIVEGTDNSQLAVKEELDLAYVHVNKNGFAFCLGKELGLECDPCTDPFPYPANSSINSQLPKIENAQKQSNIYYFEKATALTGELRELKYEDFGGNWWTTYILVLNNPIRVVSTSSNYSTQENVLEIQIGFNFNIVNDPKIYLYKQITLSGMLYGEQTVHDRRPVIMVNAIIN